MEARLYFSMIEDMRSSLISATTGVHAMTINDIEKNALAIMFTNYEQDLTDQDVDLLDSDEYRKYTVNMKACINRALTRIQQAGVLPLKSKTLTCNTPGINNGFLTRYSLKDTIKDLYKIKRIVLSAPHAYEPSVTFHIEADTLVLPVLAREQEYVVVYEPKVSKVSLNAPSSTDIDIPDDIAELIPYFIKAELYEEDEPSLAVQARNIFETTLDSLKRDDYNTQASVVNVTDGGYDVF